MNNASGTGFTFEVSKNVAIFIVFDNAFSLPQPIEATGNQRDVTPLSTALNIKR
jgi:hypothetical protein